MAIDTKLNLSSEKFEQYSGETLNLSGCTNIYGVMKITNAGSLCISQNAGLGKVITSDATGKGTWQDIPTSVAITGATNGLSIVNSNVKLGGTLCDTVTSIAIPYSGGSLDISSSSGPNYYGGRVTIRRDSEIVDNNYLFLASRWDSSNLTTFELYPSGITMSGLPAKTIETCGIYIDSNNKLSFGVISGGGSGGITGATNGLTDDGTTVCLGGTLDGDTCINYDNGCICFTDTDGNNYVGFSCGSSDIYHYDSVNQCDSNVYVESCVIYLASTDYLNGLESKISICCGNIIVGGCLDNNFCGITYDNDYSANFTCLSIPNVGWVTGQTGGICAADNGLTINGSTVCWGGTLNSSVTIDFTSGCIDFIDSGSNNSFHFGTDAFQAFHYDGTRYASDMYINNTCMSINFGDSSTQYDSWLCGGACHFNLINKCGSAITTINTGVNNINVCSYIIPSYVSYSGFSGITYAHDYSAKFIDRSLVDKGYVDKAISGATSGGTGVSAFSGLTDVSIVSVAEDDVVVYRSGKWCNEPTTDIGDYFVYKTGDTLTGVIKYNTNLTISGDYDIPYKSWVEEQISGSSSMSVFLISGDSSATGFTVNHTKNQQFVMVQVVQAASPYATVYTDVERPNAYCVCIKFSVAPTTGTNYRILISG